MDKVIARLGVSVILIHHFGKGGGTDRTVADSFRGASSLVGDVDAMVGVLPHAEEGNFIIRTSARSFKTRDAFVAFWQYPHWVLADGKDADDTRKPGRKAKANDEGILEQIPVGVNNGLSIYQLEEITKVNKKQLEKVIRVLKEKEKIEYVTVTNKNNRKVNLYYRLPIEQ
jgi:hypothetical protein